MGSRARGLIAPGTERMYKASLKRRHHFASKEDAFQAYSTRGFKHFDKTVLRAYVEHGFTTLPGKSRPAASAA